MKSKNERIIHAIVKNYMIESRDATVNYLTRCADLESEWKNSNYTLDQYLEYLKMKGTEWKSATEYVAMESEWWD